MVEIDRAAVVAVLVLAGARRDVATLYADAFCEYREASRNIAEHGAIVQHPRTANPIVNPYLVVRDQAWRKLQIMADVPSAALW